MQKAKSLKKFILIAILALLLPCFLFLGGCGEAYVSSIEFTGLNGTTNIYTVTYSNGKTSTIAVENGKDANLTLEDIFNACVKQGLYNEDEFEKFLKAYITTNVEEDLTNAQLNVYSSLNSAVAIYTAFEFNGTYRETQAWSGSQTKGYTGYDVFTGAGVVYKMNDNYSYILTNCHVVTFYDSNNIYKLPKEIAIYQYGHEPKILTSKVNINGITDYGDNYYINDVEFRDAVTATCVGYSLEYDLAVLRVNTQDLLNKNADTQAVTVADGYKLLDEVYAIGNPSGYGISLTKGVVSVYSEEIDIDEMPVDNLTHTYRCMRIDNAVYGGNSGGGLFDINGNLVGIVNAGSESGDNWSFALPIDAVIPCADNLIYYYENGGAIYRAKAFTMDNLGVRLNNNYKNYNSATSKVTYDVCVQSVAYNSVLSGDVEVNDIITAITIDGKTFDITNKYQLDDALLNVRPNSKVTFSLNRSGAVVKADISTLITTLLQQV